MTCLYVSLGLCGKAMPIFCNILHLHTFFEKPSQVLLAAHENLNDRIAAGAKVAAHRSTLHRLAIDSASAGDHGAWWPPRATADWLSLHLKWPSAVGQRRLGPYFLSTTSAAQMIVTHGK